VANIFFDIEAGGFSNASILSISYGIDNKPIQTLGANPAEGSIIGVWADSKVWQPLKKSFAQQGKEFTSEKEMLNKFISVLKANKDSTLIGWFSGYVDNAFDLPNKPHGFDIPKLQERAAKYGLDKELASALSKIKIRDLGQETALRLAHVVTEAPYGIIDPHLKRQSLGYTKASKWVKLYETGKNTVSGLSDHAHKLASWPRPVRMSGWKQELVYQVLTGKPLANAHMSEADVGGLREIHNLLSNRNSLSIKELREWNRLALQNKLISSVMYDNTTEDILAEAARIETKYSYKSFTKNVQKGLTNLADTYRVPLEYISESTQFNEATYTVNNSWFIPHINAEGIIDTEVYSAKKKIFQAADEEVVKGLKKAPKLLERTASFVKNNTLLLGLALGVGILSLVKPLSLISGDDDDYNTIEGLGHDGTASRLRHMHTDFGSGYQGPRVSAGISTQTDDGVITEKEYGSFLRKIRRAYNERLSLQLISREKVVQAYHSQVRWDHPKKRDSVQVELYKRKFIGDMGQFDSSNNTLSVGGFIDPITILSDTLQYVPRARAAREIGEWTYSVLSPSRIKETTLHEGLHSIWQNDLRPEDKQLFMHEAERQLDPGWLYSNYGPDVEALRNKAPVYAQVINLASSPMGPNWATEWVANELFAHRGAALRYKEDYAVSNRVDLDTAVGRYVSPIKKRISTQVTFEKGFNPSVATEKFFARPPNRRPIKSSPSRVNSSVVHTTGSLPWASTTKVARQQKKARPIPTSLLGTKINPTILDFRKKVINDREARKAFESELQRKQDAAQAKLGQLRESDFLSIPVSTIEGVNTKDDKIRRVDASKFNIEIEDADTVFLHRKDIVSRVKELFGYGKIAVRLAGIDAPETTGHSDDPLDNVRIWQNQVWGEQATKSLRQMAEAQGSDLGITVSTGRKTYGRYLGIVSGKDDKNLNLELTRTGDVSALPFGPADEDILLRGHVRIAEEEARSHKRGMWQYARYQAERLVNVYKGRTTTHNTFTRIDKLASNLLVGAEASFLESLGDEKRDLTTDEINLSRRFGRSLYYQSRKHKNIPKSNQAYAQHEGLQHNGVAWQMRQQMTEFGSGVLRKILSKNPTWIDENGAIRGISDKMFKFLAGATDTKNIWGQSYRIKSYYRQITQSKKILRKQGIWEEAQHVRRSLRSLEDLGQKNATFFNPNLSSSELSETILHERVHQFTPIVLQKVLKKYSKKFRASNPKFSYAYFANKNNIIEEAAAYTAEGNLYGGNLGLVQQQYAKLSKYLKTQTTKQQLRFAQQLPRPSKFSGFNDEYNTIEGLRHDGIAQYIRHNITPFGSGYDIFKNLTETTRNMASSKQAMEVLRKYLGSDVLKNSMHAIQSAGTELGSKEFIKKVKLGEFLQKTTEGDTFAIGKELGKGGFGKVESAYNLKTSKQAVYKTSVKNDASLTELYTNFNTDSLIMPGGRGWTPLMNEDPKFTVGILKEQQDAMRRTYLQFGSKHALLYEAEMQQKANNWLPDAVPKMLGVVNNKQQIGFFQEMAGRTIDRTNKREVGDAMFFLKEQARKMYGATENVPVHIDLHLSQVLRDKDNSFKLIDWGLATLRKELDNPTMEYVVERSIMNQEKRLLANIKSEVKVNPPLKYAALNKTKLTRTDTRRRLSREMAAGDRTHTLIPTLPYAERKTYTMLRKKEQAEIQKKTVKQMASNSSSTRRGSRNSRVSSSR